MLLSQTRDTDLQRDAEVSDTLANHPDIVQAIEDVDWGKVEIHVDMLACFGKADLVILYNSLNDWDAIHNILTENPFLEFRRKGLTPEMLTVRITCKEKAMSKKFLIFSTILTFAILLSACQLPAATTGATSTVQVTPSSTSVPTIIEYQNTEYGFSFSLPVSWKGYSIITDIWRGYDNGNSEITVEQGPIISIRHPLWTSENPYQDIPIMVFTLAQWNSLQQNDYSVSAGGIYTELGRNAKYVFSLYSRYNFVTLPGMEEVKTILEGNPLHIP